MFLIRSSELRDISALLKLGRILNSYNLPADKKVLQKILKASQSSFTGKVKDPEKRRFLFVAEEVRSGKVVGCSLVIGRHGSPQLPHLSFDLARETKTSRTLKKRVAHTTLSLNVDPSGYTEIGGLVVLPHYRRREERIGKQLSYARFAYMAGHRGYFQRRLLVEYLPKLDHLTGNKLWRAVGQKFTRLTYREADRLSSLNKEFILSLFPREKIYCALLPASAVKDLGSPGVGAEASRKMLSRIGFRFLKQIDPFDGGHHYGARLAEVSLVKKTRKCKWGGGQGLRDRSRSEERPVPTRRGLLMAEKNGKVRAVVSDYKIKKGCLLTSDPVARVLGVKNGGQVSVTPF